MSFDPIDTLVYTFDSPGVKLSICVWGRYPVLLMNFRPIVPEVNKKLTSQLEELRIKDEQGRTRTDNLWRRKPTRCHCATHPSRSWDEDLQLYVALTKSGK